MTQSITCTIITLNEVERLGRTIASVQGLVDEILVVDSGSTDGTQALATSLGARVVYNKWQGYGQQKRMAEELALNDWILNLDADEWLSPALAQEIAQLRQYSEWPARSFAMRLRLVYAGRSKPAPFAEFHNYVRLYDRRATRFADSAVFDEVAPTTDVRQLEAPAYHQSFVSLSQMVIKQLGYFTLQKREIKKSRWKLALRMPIEFPTQFFKFYILRRRIFGGFYGLALSLTEAFTRTLRVFILFGW